MGLSALAAQIGARWAERTHPPLGHFVHVDGLQVHMIEAGSGAPVVFLHGNGGMIYDVVVSGLFDRVAERGRAIAIDRPGFGYTPRPRGHTWGAREQAAVVARVLDELGLERAVIVGHSWGTMAALALALDRPERVEGLVLVAGYYFPSMREDTVLFSPAGLPAVGDIVSSTVGPFVGRVVGPLLITRMFAPKAPTERFNRQFPLDLALRPGQIKAFAQDALHMATSAQELCPRYGELRCPVTIVTGDSDHIVDVDYQSGQLHRTVPQSRLVVAKGEGHMVHHHAPEMVADAIAQMMRNAAVPEAPAPATARPTASL